ncbi:hypothetical protein F5X98DRAFT_327189 [Xylaria grammica]|nr:hypothetical protein F5X98DRAFT_327189 [Xylaria grammica]
MAVLSGRSATPLTVSIMQPTTSSGSTEKAICHSREHSHIVGCSYQPAGDILRWTSPEAGRLSICTACPLRPSLFRCIIIIRHAGTPVLSVRVGTLTHLGYWIGWVRYLQCQFRGPFPMVRTCSLQHAFTKANHWAVSHTYLPNPNQNPTSGTIIMYLSPPTTGTDSVARACAFRIRINRH